MKIIITGVAGFIGSHLAARLLKDGHEIIGLDNLSYGLLRNIHPIQDHPAFTFIQGDLANPFVFGEHRADVIVHLASQKIPRYSSALRTLDENQLLLKNVVTKALRDKSKVVFASTSDVYGKNPDLPFHEESNLVLGSTKVRRWAYALSKIYGEHLLYAYQEDYGLDFSIVRFFGSYGPHHNLTWWGGPQSVFINKAINKETIEVHGDGMQQRTFTFIEDTIEGLQFAVTRKEANGEVFNIGADARCETTINNLAVMIWRLVNGPDSEPAIQLIPYSNFGNYEDVMRRIPDTSKLNQYFGYTPQWSLEEGLKKTIAWQRTVLND